MEKNSTAGSSTAGIDGFSLSGLDIEPESRGEPEPEPEPKPVKDTTEGKKIDYKFTEEAFLDLIKLPYRFIAAFRGKPYWELDQKESSLIKKTAKCVIRIIPEFLLKISCGLTFGLTMLTITAVRIRREMSERPKDETSYENEDEDKESIPQEQPETQKVLGKGVRSE